MRFSVRVRGLSGARVDVIMDGKHGVALANKPIDGGDVTLDFSLPGDGVRHWIRADARSGDGARTLMVGNPIYLNR